MKSHFLKLVLFFSSALVLNSVAQAQDFFISQSVGSKPIQVTQLSFELDGAIVKPEAMGSSAILSLVGTYDGGWCAFDSMAMQQTFEKDGTRDINTTINLVGISKPSGNFLSAIPSGCTSGLSGKFTLFLEVKIKSWGSKQSSQAFNFSIPTAAGIKKAKVVFDAKQGWSLSL